MKYYKKIVGSKVYLSPLSLDDAHLFTNWLNDEEVVINLSLMPSILSLSGEKSFLETMCANNNDFCIVDKETDKVIGVCGYMGEDKTHRNVEIGIFIGSKDHWSKGYGTDALKLLLDYGFKVRNYNNIMLRVFSYNKRAIKCYEKAGFKKIGARREALIYGERKFDIIYMDIIASEHKTDYLEKYFD